MYPDLPVIELTDGQARCRVADPRGGATELGARYVHGGYVLDLYDGDRCLTASPSKRWEPRKGRGLPEVFEAGFGFSFCPVGDLFLRVGAGRIRREADDDFVSSGRPLEQGLEWAVEQISPSVLRMHCRDELEIGGRVFGYALSRELLLEEKRLVSRSELQMQVPWCEPLLWFAHPFFAQTSGGGTGLELVDGIEPADDQLARDDSGCLHFGNEGGFCVLRGAWGSTEPVRLHLQHGQDVAIRLSRPLEKLVVFATPSAFSIEPYFSRGWMNGERASWEIEYVW